MLLTDQIQQRVQGLPEPLQAEVLDFILYLLYRVDRESTDLDDREWSNLSLHSAMRGMEDEDGPDYSVEDLKTRFG